MQSVHCILRSIAILLVIGSQKLNYCNDNSFNSHFETNTVGVPSIPSTQPVVTTEFDKLHSTCVHALVKGPV